MGSPMKVMQKFHLLFAKGLSNNRYRSMRFFGVLSLIGKFFGEIYWRRMIMRMALTVALGVASTLVLSSAAFAQTIHRMPEPVQFFQAVGDNCSHWGRTPDTVTGDVVVAPAPRPLAQAHRKIQVPIESYRAVGNNGSHGESYQ